MYFEHIHLFVSMTLGMRIRCGKFNGKTKVCPTPGFLCRVRKGEGEEEYTNGYPDNESGRQNEDAGQGKLQISYCISFDCVRYILYILSKLSLNL